MRMLPLPHCKSVSAQYLSQPQQMRCGCGGKGPLPEVTFSTFVLSLASAALVHLGEVADPETGDERPLTVRKYSDRLMEVLLKWRYGDQMADRLRVKVDSTGLDAEALLRMSADERKALTGLLSKYHANKEQDDDE